MPWVLGVDMTRVSERKRTDLRRRDIGVVFRAPDAGHDSAEGRGAVARHL
ncbi:hypothetical protein [Caenispirillum salinarum]